MRALAERERSPGLSEASLSSKRAALASLRNKRERAGENLALAEGPEQYRAVAAVFEQLRQQEQALAVEVHRLEQLGGNESDLDAEVAAALAVLDRLGEQASRSPDLGSIGQLFRQSRISAVSKTINLLGRRLLESFGAKLLCHFL